MTLRKTRNTIEKFESYFTPEPNTGCWLWHGYSPNGRYGALSWAGKKRVLAHVVSYMHYNKQRVPKGKFLDHRCKNTFCVSPEHLEPVTHVENVRRGRLASSPMCKHGHLYADGFEYYTRPDTGTRYRRCLTCYRMRFPRTIK